MRRYILVLICGTIFAIAALVSGASQAGAGLLDGRIFEGRIGPAEAPDLKDRLHFAEGHFWSGLCTECGFHPGAYSARKTDSGIAFDGVLTSESRGRFDYEGLVRPDGSITVTIAWSRSRWYWKARRQLAFVGNSAPAGSHLSLKALRDRMAVRDPGSNPQCARF